MNATENFQSVKNQRICEQLVRREIGCCVSSLVHHFATNESALGGSDYSYDDILELCRKDDYETPVEEFIDDMSRADCVEYLESLSIQCYDEESDKVLRKAVFENAKEEGIQEFASERRIDPYDDEVYEHWIVSDWFAAKLRDKGEITGELVNLTIWGRTCTGQAIHLDAVIGEIAADMEILEGQANDWSKQS